MALEPGHEIRLTRRAREAVDLLADLHHEQGGDAPHVVAVGDSRRVVDVQPNHLVLFGHGGA